MNKKSLLVSVLFVFGLILVGCGDKNDDINSSEKEESNVGEKAEQEVEEVFEEKTVEETLDSPVESKYFTFSDVKLVRDITEYGDNLTISFKLKNNLPKIDLEFSYALLYELYNVDGDRFPHTTNEVKVIESGDEEEFTVTFENVTGDIDKFVLIGGKMTNEYGEEMSFEDFMGITLDLTNKEIITSLNEDITEEKAWEMAKNIENENERYELVEVVDGENGYWIVRYNHAVNSDLNIKMFINKFNGKIHTEE